MEELQNEMELNEASIELKGSGKDGIYRKDGFKDGEDSPEMLPIAAAMSV